MSLRMKTGFIGFALVCALQAQAATAPVTLVYPTGGELFQIGTTQRITLGAKILLTQATVELSRDGGTSFSTLGTITVQKKIIPTYDFAVNAPASNKCVLRISGQLKGITVSVSSALFTIMADLSAGTTPLDGSVTTAKIVDGSVTSTKITDGTVNTIDLADGAVTNLKLATGCVTYDKVNSGPNAPNYVLASDGSGGASWSTPAAIGVGTLTLPYQGNYADIYTAFQLNSTGTNTALNVNINNGVNSNPAIDASTIGTGPALRATANGGGSAAVFSSPLTTSGGTTVSVAQSGSGEALDVHSSNGQAPATYTQNDGTGSALKALATGSGQFAYAGDFEISNGTSNASAVYAQTNGIGSAGYFTTNKPANPNAALTAESMSTAFFARADGTSGGAGIMRIYDSTNSDSALAVSTQGPGTVLLVQHNGTSGSIAIFQSGGNSVARIDKTGKGFFNGGTQASGADVAEAFAVEGKRAAYEPGDVLVVSTASDRTVAACGEAYSTRVMGVFATKPGLLLSERNVDASQADLVPVGVVGVIPTKVCAENGPIARGDLLVTSSWRGHAMKATPGKLGFGMVIGKALEPFDAKTSCGVIEVMVNVK